MKLNLKKYRLDNDYYNSKITLFFFFSTILFSLTIYRFIWSIENYSRLVNVFLLTFGVLYFTIDLFKNKYPIKVMVYIILPSILIFIGMCLNIIMSAFSDATVLSNFGEVLPWVVLLMIPALYRKKKIDYIKLWKYSYYFMLVSVILGLFDYVIIYFFGGSATILETSYGTFLSGNFSVLHMLKDGTPHLRFYSCFAEPGSLAMLLLPFIAYAIYKKRYIGLIILLIGFVLTNSLGGYISALMMLFIMTYFSVKKNKFILISFLILCPIFIYNTTNDFFTKSYEIRNQGFTSSENSSVNTRVLNFTNGILNVPSLIFSNPFGIKLASTTSQNIKNEYYIGSNFLPIYYLQSGGLLAFIGYLMILYISIKTSVKILRSYNQINVEYKVVAISLIIFAPFLVQRTTIWETAWFGFLYAPIIINSLKISSKKLKNS